MEITSARLKLRFINEGDLEAIHSLHSLAETDRFNTLGMPKDLAQTKAVISPWIEANLQKPLKNYTFAIELSPNPEFIT